MDLSGVGDALGPDLAAPVCTELCRGEMDRYEAAVREGGRLLVACTQEAPLFTEVADDMDAPAELSFVNIRETAGWGAAGGSAGAKILALLADAQARADQTPTPVREVESDGLCLVYGKGQTALDAAFSLEDTLSVTLVLCDWEDVVLPAILPFPVYSGRLKRVGGSLGRFDVTLDGYAEMLPSSRQSPEFQLPRDGAKASCSLVVDLSGGEAAVTAPQKRDGYFRADPADRAAVERLMRAASQMVGTFEKPIYVNYNPDICAHTHAGKTGCSKCLDACPAGALTSLDGKIAVDTGICGGCGSCSATCPTGAITYQHPARNDLLERIQILLGAYRDAGGAQPVLLLHEANHGSNVINAMARFGDGLPANVLPLPVHAVTAIGHDGLMTAFMAGAARIVLLSPPEKRHELVPLETEIALTEALLSGMGHMGSNRITLLAATDPDDLAAVFMSPLSPLGLSGPARILPVGGKRDVARMVIGAVHKASPAAPAVVPLPGTAPYGRIHIDSAGCTLCLSCVSACPAGALLDNPDRPQVSFIESACVQCGLCQTTCPERVITLEPRFNTLPDAMRPSILKEDEPAACISCGKPFGTKATVSRIKEKLAGKHHMFRSDLQIQMIEMCDDCRIQAQWDANPDLGNVGGRPKPRTTEDYLDAEKRGLSMDDFLKN
ncbi:ferredoxin [Roseibium aquae]|uniref:Ferredoxin n=2 Tax=Roseibium aquae TaxID=1323746 RepID=A0A916WZ55_9HYPH|nr:ferredoxin [Roseibium aquae]